MGDLSLNTIKTFNQYEKPINKNWKNKIHNKMKNLDKIVIVLILLVYSIVAVYATRVKTSDYCQGWKSGYERGWCSEKVNCIFDTVVPVCPVPETNLTSKKDGFDRGFTQALKDRK